MVLTDRQIGYIRKIAGQDADDVIQATYVAMLQKNVFGNLEEKQAWRWVRWQLRKWKLNRFTSSQRTTTLVKDVEESVAPEYVSIFDRIPQAFHAAAQSYLDGDRSKRTVNALKNLQEIMGSSETLRVL